MTSSDRDVDWASRPAPQAWGPKKLGAFVEAAVAGADAMLFTATPREQLDEIGRFQ